MAGGSDLPKPLSGHCQIFIEKGHVLIYGGITSVRFNNSKQYFEYSNQAFYWSNGSWLHIFQENPCGNNGQDLSFQQPCVSRMRSNDAEAIIVTFVNGSSCTSILNLRTRTWMVVGSFKTNIPIGGHLVTSLDKSRVFYLGGLYYEPHETQSLDIYELKASGWRLIEPKLPFGISSNETKSYRSSHNVTLT